MQLTYRLKLAAEVDSNETNIARSMPKVECLILGVCSLVILLGNAQFSFSITSYSSWIWNTIYLISFPHFIASYFLFYRNSRFKKHYKLVAGIIPVTLLLVLTAVVCLPDRIGIVYLASFAYPLLFWHFLKQTYGVSLACANLREIPKAIYFKRVLLVTCLLIGATGYVSTQIGLVPIIVFDIYTPVLDLPILWVESLTLLSVFAFVILVLVADKEKVCLSSLLPVLTLFIWMSPQFTRNGFYLVLPLLHGLQYLPYCYRRIMSSGEVVSKNHFQPLLWITFFLIGYLIFKVCVPSFGSLVTMQHPERLMPAVFIFINLHHYAMDAVLWRSPTR